MEEILTDAPLVEEADDGDPEMHTLLFISGVFILAGIVITLITTLLTRSASDLGQISSATVTCKLKKVQECRFILRTRLIICIFAVCPRVPTAHACRMLCVQTQRQAQGFHAPITTTTNQARRCS